MSFFSYGPKLISLVVLVAVQVSVAVVYNLSQSKGKYTYSPASAIAVAEFIKFIISAGLHWKNGGAWSLPATSFTSQVFGLAGLYCLNNQLAFVLYLYLDSASISLFKSWSTVIAAFLLWVLFHRAISRLQWSAIMLQVLGLCIVQYNPCKGATVNPLHSYILMIFSTTITAVCSVWNENLIKTSNISLNIQNMLLYCFGFFLNLGVFFVLPPSNPAAGQSESGEKLGFFEGYNTIVLGVIACNGLIGLVITAVYKYADAIIKTFATACSTCLLLFINTTFFGFSTSIVSFFGTGIVFIASFIYMTNPQAQPAPTSPNNSTHKDSQLPLVHPSPPSLPAKSGLFSIRSLLLVMVIISTLVTINFTWSTFTFTSPVDSGSESIFPPSSSSSSSSSSLPLPSSDHLMVNITCAEKSKGRLVTFTNSFDANNITYTTAFNDTLPDWIWYIEIIDTRKPQQQIINKFVIDGADDGSRLYETGLEWGELYFKTSFMPFEKATFDSPVAFPRYVTSPEARNLAKKYAQKFMDINIYHGAWTTDRTKPTLVYPHRTPVEKKEVILTTQSFSTSVTADARNRLYDFIYKTANDTFKADFDVRVNNGTRIWASKFLDDKDIGNYKTYTDFIGRAYFLLNLVGIGGSQPMRLNAACLTGTAVVSEAIYARSAKSFPRYTLSADTQINEFNEVALTRELEYLFAHYKTVFERLIPAQNQWCDEHLSEPAYIHTMLRHLKGQPFADKLHNFSPSLFYNVYFNYTRWKPFETYFDFLALKYD